MMASMKTSKRKKSGKHSDECVERKDPRTGNDGERQRQRDRETERQIQRQRGEEIKCETDI